MVQCTWNAQNEELGVVPPGLILAHRAAFEANSVDVSCGARSAGAEAGLLQPYCRAGGPVTSGMQAFLGRGAVQIRRRRLGGRAVRGGAASRLYRVSKGDEVDAASAQYYVNSSLAPVLLLRRRISRLLTFFVVFVSMASLRVGGMLCPEGGIRSVNRALAAQFAHWSLEHTGSTMIFMGSTSVFLMHWTFLTTPLNDGCSIVGILD